MSVKNKGRKTDIQGGSRSQSGISLIVKDTGKYGMGVYAGKNIGKGEIIKVFGGEIISFDECVRRIKQGIENQADSLQVGLEKDLDMDELSRTFNHSCSPNAGVRKVRELFALKNIKRGEEIVFDYSATIGPNIAPSLWSMRCKCGSGNCRKTIGNVLTIPEKTLRMYHKWGALQSYIKKELKRIKKTRDGSFILPMYKKIVIK